MLDIAHGGVGQRSIPLIGAAASNADDRYSLFAIHHNRLPLSGFVGKS